MGTVNVSCTRNSVEYAASGAASTWTSGAFYSGKSGDSKYRSRIKFTTGSGWAAGEKTNNKKFIVKIKINGTSSPTACYAVLSTANLAPGRVMNDALTGPSSTYLGSGSTGYVGSSYSYTSAAATTRVTGTNQASGYSFYFSFSSVNIKPNTTYYVYCMYKSGTDSGSGWTQAATSGISAYVVVNTYTLTLDKDTGVASFTCNATDTNTGTFKDGILAKTTATASKGYHLSSYTGTAAKGYTQTNWSITQTDPSQPHEISWTMSVNRTITAHASPNTYNITFNPNGGSNVNTGNFASGNTLTVTYKATTFSNLSDELPSRGAQYEFTGWWTASSGGTRVYDRLGMAVPGTNYWDRHQKWIYLSNLTLYAQWKLKTYLIVFDANGGTNEPDPISKTHGTSVILPEGSYKDATTQSVTTTFDYNYTGAPTALTSESLVTTTYTFDNWNTKSDGSGTGYSAGSTYTEDKDTTLFASYYPSAPVGAEVTLPNVSRVGYTLLGWSRTPSGGIIEGSYCPSMSTTLYAKWQANSYKVFLMDNDSIIDTFSVQYDQTIQLPDFSESALSEANCTSNVTLIGSALDNQGSTIQLNIPISVTKELQHTFYQGYDADEQDIPPWNTTSYHHIYTHNVSIKRGYTETGNYYLNFKMPNQNTYPQAYKQLVNWHCTTAGSVLPLDVTPGSVVKFRCTSEPQGTLGNYKAQYIPVSKIRMFINQNNSYKVGTPFVKINNTFIRGDAYYIKAGGRWMTLLEYLNTFS